MKIEKVVMVMKCRAKRNVKCMVRQGTQCMEPKFINTPNCPIRISISNADYIRAMNDKALADFIKSVSEHCTRTTEDGDCLGCKRPWCVQDELIDWLRQPLR